MFEIGSNNLTTAGTVIDRKVDHPAVCRLTLERGHQYHLLCHQAPPSSSRIILSVALEIPSTAVNMSKGRRGPRAIRLILLRVSVVN
jgi:hypothetical protein